MSYKKAISPLITLIMLIGLTIGMTILFESEFKFIQEDLFLKNKEEIKSTGKLDILSVKEDKLFLNSENAGELEIFEIVNSKGKQVCNVSVGRVNKSGLVGWWKFDEENGIIKDYSGFGNDGKLFGDSKLILDFDEGINDRTGYENYGGVLGDESSKLMII